MLLWLALGLGALTFIWLRRSRQARQRWLETLNLVGKWELEPVAGDDGNSGRPRQRTLTLSGELAAGQYVAKDDGALHRGEWRLKGGALILSPTEGEAAPKGPERYELRLFETGRIGLDGPGRQREVYVKRDGNVIPLLRRPTRRK